MQAPGGGQALPFASALRFLFASQPVIMGRVLAIGYRVISTHLINKTSVPRSTSRTGAVTLIQRIGRYLDRQSLLHRETLLFGAAFAANRTGDR